MRPPPASLGAGTNELAAFDEVEPCLCAGNSSGDSACSGFSSVSQRRPDHARRLILFILIVFILLLAVIFSFIGGSWLSRQPFSHFGDVLNDSLPVPFPSASLNRAHSLSTTAALFSSTVTTSPPNSSSVPIATSTSVAPSTAWHAHKLILLPALRSAMSVTLEDVAEPLDEDEEHAHSPSRALRPEGDTLLVPLPQAMRPLHYQLSLDLTRFSSDHLISGRVNISLESFGNSTGEELVLHASHHLNIQQYRLRRDGRYIPIVSTKQESNKKLFRLLLKERLWSGRYTLELAYTTKICRQAGDGVNCHFEPVQGTADKKLTSFTTKFEPTLARNFLPCWDEPSVKATFDVSVRYETGWVVLSNTAAVQTRHNRRLNMTVTKFRRSPPMPVYLLAFAVGDFVKLEMQTVRQLPVNIWTFAEDKGRAEFAATFSPKMLDIHENEFEIAYPLAKLDFLAARSFPVGAMENWGLVVFDSNALLQQPELDESVNMTVDRHHDAYRMARIITHELAHQWFGNLVTMADWSELWLNEAFASFFVYDLLTDRFPALTDTEYHHRLAQLFRKQSGSSNERKALVRQLRTEAEVEAAFHSTHLYTKGAVVVRLIRHLLSPLDFRAGIRRYLRKNQYKSVTRKELWAALPAYADHGAENERLEDVVETWLINRGLPEVTVTRNYDTDMIRVTQRASLQNRHRIFLHDFVRSDGRELSEDPLSPASLAAHTLFPLPYPTSDMRRRRSEWEVEKKEESRNSGESTPFDDTLFELIPHDEQQQQGERNNNRTKHRKKQNSHRPLPSRGWTERVRVTRLPSVRGPEDAASAEKRRAAPEAAAPSPIWSIPFTYMFGSVRAAEGQVMRQFWLHNKTVAFADAELSATAPLLANPDWAHPFRVNYDAANWKMLARMLHTNHHEIPSKSRMQLIVDAEFFLSQSALPHVYIYLLGYLSAETSLGVALLGLDAVHRVVQSFQATRILPSLLRYLTPVINRLDALLYESQSDVEQAALWLLDPQRLTKLYQLRCAAELRSCESEETARHWLHMGLFSRDMHQKTTALCHFLFTSGGDSEIARIEAELSSPSVDPTMLHLSACIRGHPSLSSLAATLVVSQRNAAVYDSILRSDFTQQHYNVDFRTAFWRAVASLSEQEKRFLFSVDEPEPSPKSTSLLHAIRSSRELQEVHNLLPTWGRMSVHIDYLARLLSWQEKMSDGVLKKFLTNDAPSV